MPRRSAADLNTPPVKLVEPALPVELPPAPEHLSPAMKQWSTQTVEAYVLEAHHLKLLEICASSWDTMVEARDTLRREGLTVPTGDGGRKAHPCAAILRDAKAQFMVGLRELDLDEPMPSAGAYRPPPAIRSNRRR
jgi:phage terminase small subunit